MPTTRPLAGSAGVVGRQDAECRYVARHQSEPVTLYAAWPTGLLGAAHIVSLHLDALDSDGAPGDDIPHVEDEAPNLMVHVDGQQIDSDSIRRCCLRAVVRKSYAVWRTSVGEGEHEWEAARIKGAREGELFAWTPEGLLGVALSREHYGDACMGHSDIPDLWSEMPGEGWDDE